MTPFTCAVTNKIVDWTTQRDGIAQEMKAMLDGAAFNDQVFDEVRGKQLINQAQALLEEVRDCATDPVSCAQ